MDNDAVNGQIRKCLKQFGVTSQQAIQDALDQALAEGRLNGSETLALRMTLEVDGVALEHTVEGELKLDGDDASS
ncbi:MAG: DUF6494 family protein [Ectothiorhodospiraceae bacterium]